MNGSVSSARVISAWVPPVTAESAIYRCGAAGSQRFSQIPCEENSEQVNVEDHFMLKEAGVTDPADSMQAEDSAADHADVASKAQAFITQLEKQRNEQLAEIDRFRIRGHDQRRQAAYRNTVNCFAPTP